MTSSSSIVCEFCATLNPVGNEHCLACGAPLPKILSTEQPAQRTAAISEPVRPKTVAKASDANRQLQQARETGEQIEDLSRKALYAYSLFWRTLAEAAAIAMTAFGIGLIGGITGTSGLAVPGAVLVGIGVGYAIKIPIIALFSAPVGLLVGALTGGLLYLMGAGLWVFSVSSSLFAFLAALLGGSNIRRSQVNFYEKLRPLIGSAGGLVFGLLGMLLGLGLRAAVNALLVTVSLQFS